MKRLIFKGITTLAVTTSLFILSGNLFAQPFGRGMRNFESCPRMGMPVENSEDKLELGACNIPELTADQEAKLKEFRTKHLKEITPLKNELNEKHARLQTLESADKLDMAAIDKTIDEIAQIKAKLMKKHIAHRAEVASILTDDQKVFFNAHGRGNRGGMGNGHRHGAGFGQGFGSDHGRGHRNWE